MGPDDEAVLMNRRRYNKYATEFGLMTLVFIMLANVSIFLLGMLYRTDGYLEAWDFASYEHNKSDERRTVVQWL